ncbi:MAG: dihydropteroate synthase [Labilithrix sp.]|nr:dihydropteroate synthase [Labilithrix sp.]
MTRSSRFAGVVRGAVARRGAALMGICNVTPDSFSDGGRFFDRDAACARVDELIAAGADIIDVGGESTRPGSKAVPPREQIARVLHVVQHAAERGACVSIDTTSAEVAAACLDVGAHAVNDVSLLSDPDLARVVAGSGGCLVLSHARGPQERMSGYGAWPLGAYDDVVVDVVAEWERAAARASELGVPRSSLVMDPGLGFSKASRHSFELLRRAGQLVAAVAVNGEVPVLFGASRKSFLTLVDPQRPCTGATDAQASRGEPAEREGASIAAALHAVRAGVHILRVHDVRATRQAIDMEIVLGTPRRKI